MSVSIQINGRVSNNSLVHRGSLGVARSTLPDVCLSPGTAVPVPYPVIVSVSSDLEDGTMTVRVDGGNSVAVKGSTLSKCSGDEPGAGGGIKSGTNKKEAKWLLYSFDVVFEGRNACRLSDKMSMNHGNTACLAGILQGPVIGEAAGLGVLAELQRLCDMMCEQRMLGDARQWAIAARLWAEDEAMQNLSPFKVEAPFSRTTFEPYLSRNNPLRTTRGRPAGSAIPDVVITNGGPPVPGNIRAVVEMKFARDTSGRQNIPDYEDIAGADKFIMLEEGENCQCEDDGKRAPVLKPVEVVAALPERRFDWGELGLAVGWGVVTGLAAAATVAAAISPFEGPAGEIVAGTATAGSFARMTAAMSRIFQYAPAIP